MGARVSKNAREGGRVKQAKPMCPQGHELTPVERVPVFGRARMVLMCECNGYKPVVQEGRKS